MLSIERIREIADKYTKLAEESDDNLILDIVNAASAALEYYELIDTEADKLTFGEYTRRYENAVIELKDLVS